MKSPCLELCPHVSLCTGIRSSKYKCLINVQLFTFIPKSLNKLYIGLFVSRSSNSLKLTIFWSLSFWTFFLKFRQFWPKYLGTITWFIPNHHKNYYPPSPQPPKINVEKISRQHVWQLCKQTLQHWNGGMGEMKSNISIVLSKVDLFQHFWPTS